jgi:hypothetical protein
MFADLRQRAVRHCDEDNVAKCNGLFDCAGLRESARQVFFTVVGREEKYKAKNLIDVVIYRGSDALYGWFYDSLQAMGLKLGAIALCALPVAAGWLFLSTALGRTQERLATETDDQGVPVRQSK